MTSSTILIIDDDAVDRKAVCRALAQAGWEGEIVQADSAAEAHHQLATHSFNCILLDYRIPGTDGLALLAELRPMLAANTAIVMLTGEGSEMIAVEAMKRGISDYLPKSLLSPDTLLRVITKAIETQKLQCELTKAHAQIEQLALYDGLTHLGNRSLFIRDLEQKFAITKRHMDGSFCLLMMDLDNFKLANDMYGHDAGDAVLTEVGRRLREIGRVADNFYRLGGDEFTAIIDTDNEAVILAIVERIIQRIRKPIVFKHKSISIGISIGVAIHPIDGNSSKELLRAADKAMYEAKKSDKRYTFVSTKK